MKPIDHITTLDLYAYAKAHNLLNARIRICDGMAVSYYPDPRSVLRGRYEVILDVSANDTVEFDELDAYAQPIYDNTPGMDELDASTNEHFDALDAKAHAQYAKDRGEQNHRFMRDMNAERRKEWLRRRQAKINANQSPDDFPWPIYGYRYPKK